MVQEKGSSQVAEVQFHGHTHVNLFGVTRKIFVLSLSVVRGLIGVICGYVVNLFVVGFGLLQVVRLQCLGPRKVLWVGRTNCLLKRVDESGGLSNRKVSSHQKLSRD